MKKTHGHMKDTGRYGSQIIYLNFFFIKKIIIIIKKK